MKQEAQNKILELDLIGQYYASIINKKQPGVFNISVHLKECLNPQILQQAVNDLMRRLPFLSGRLRRGFFWYGHEILAQPPQIAPASGSPLFSDYYNRGSGHVLRVVYGEQHFTVETLHSICDGRGLTKVICALLVRYYELLGVKVDKSEIIDCSGAFQPEEAENAFVRFASPQCKTNPSRKVKAYNPAISNASRTQVISKKFSASKIKAAAKEHNATVTEYILAYIFKLIAEERAAWSNKNPITATIPIDCRSFFPSKTLRSFVSGTTVIMPETEDFSEILRHIQLQFATVNKEYVHNNISELQNRYNNSRFTPRFIKKIMMNIMDRFDAAGHTTGFSNLGIVKLPAEIEKYVDMLEFAISLKQWTPYYFSCITVDDVMSLSASYRDKWLCFVESVMERIETQAY